MSALKFDYCVSNPPYQKVINGGTVLNIFHSFQQLGLTISHNTLMIYPGGRWLQKAGRGLRKFNTTMLTNKELYKIYYYNFNESKTLFPTVRIKDGLSIVIFKKEHNNNGLLNINENTINPKIVNNIVPLQGNVVHNMDKLVKFKKIKESKKAQSFFGIESTFVELNSDKAVLCEDFSVKPPQMIDPVCVFTNDRGGSRGRPYWYWIEREDIPYHREFIDKYKIVCVSGLQGNETGIEFIKIDKGFAFGRTRMLVKAFDTSVEADNCLSYLSTGIIQELFLGSIMGRQSSFGVFVPDLEDYSMNNDLFKSNDKLGNEHEYYNLSLEDRLYKFFGIDKEEFLKS